LAYIIHKVLQEAEKDLPPEKQKYFRKRKKYYTIYAQDVRRRLLIDGQGKSRSNAMLNAIDDLNQQANVRDYIALISDLQNLLSRFSRNLAEFMQDSSLVDRTSMEMHLRDLQGSAETMKEHAADLEDSFISLYNDYRKVQGDLGGFCDALSEEVSDYKTPLPEHVDEAIAAVIKGTME